MIFLKGEGKYMSKPTVFTLAGDCKNFVFSNLGVLKEHAKMIFPAVLLLELINALGNSYGMIWVQLVTVIPVLFLYACFAMSWHRVSLMGVNSARPVNPFQLEKGDLGFVGLFFGFMFLPSLAAIPVIAIMVLVAAVLGKFSEGMAVIFVLITIPFVVWGIIAVIRLGFMLPARSVGVKLTFREALRSSQGVLWPLVGTVMLFSLMYLIPLLIYGLVIAMVIGAAALGGSATPMGLGYHLAQFVITVPVLAVNFIFTAMNITALSRAYQWGIKNNPIEAA